MIKAILTVSVCFWMLAGCVSTKVDRLHTTTTKLSTDIDKFAELSNKSIEFNTALTLSERKKSLLRQLEPTGSNTGKQDYERIEKEFSKNYEILYLSKLNNQALKEQNELLVKYFKTLPLILENKNADVNGLVKNIDILNQAIEQSVTSDDELKGGLNDNEKDVISKSISSGYSAYQYHIFKKSIKNHFPIIIKALLIQKLSFKDNYIKAARGLNKEYFSAYTDIKKSYINQYSENLSGVKTDKPSYGDEDFAKIEQLIKKPYVIVNLDSTGSEEITTPKVKSQAYKQHCESSSDPRVQERLSRERQLNYIEYKEMVINPYDQNNKENKKVYFDIEQKFKNSGEQVVCELINIVGLIKENNFDRIELVTFENEMENYSQLLDYISKQNKKITDNLNENEVK